MTGLLNLQSFLVMRKGIPIIPNVFRSVSVSAPYVNVIQGDALLAARYITQKTQVIYLSGGDGWHLLVISAGSDYKRWSYGNPACFFYSFFQMCLASSFILWIAFQLQSKPVFNKLFFKLFKSYFKGWTQFLLILCTTMGCNCRLFFAWN